jgi:hypothetical protein
MRKGTEHRPVPFWTGLVVASVLSVPAGVVAQEARAEPTPMPTIEEATAGTEKRSGLLDLYVDDKRGVVWLAVPRPVGPRGEVGRFLYVEGLVSGLGSNPIGLDRGQLGPARLIVLRRLGGRLLVEQPNLGFRALEASAEERRAVQESFATSVLWAGEIAARNEDGRALVDFTSFVLRDAHGVAARLKASRQGEFALDPKRSALAEENCLAFPENLELESLLTWVGQEPGDHVRSVTPTPEAVTLVQHHSILRLPGPGYRPRRFDSRAGTFAVRFVDYAAPLDAPLERRWVVRHRLEKTDPTRPRSTVKDPIVYYVDPATPEPVRSALIEGAGWWARAFDAAGFIDAFRVELLPADAHPLDARFNVIQWVHRSTRGWSYGGGVIDPRTGEMVKGHVSLGSLRVRQDRLLFEGLLGVEKTGTGADDDPIELALARIRQLSAHEVGHTLGLSHNFAASTYGGRASVMDYPAPLVHIEGGARLDTSDAYAVGVGVWDLQAIRYAYSEFAPAEDETTALDGVIRDGLQRGMVFLSDDDARPAGAAQPLANLWDNGADPVLELEHTMRVRSLALDRFGLGNIAEGRPLARLEEVLATVYFYHRYQLEAAVKVVGGMDYRHALRGDGQPLAEPIDGARQRHALDVVLSTIDPERLELSDGTLRVLLPRPAGHRPNREQFHGATAPVFDPLAAAATAAEMAFAGLLQPQRCARLVNFHAGDPSMPSLEYVLDTIVRHAFDDATASESGRRTEIRRETQRVLVSRLVALSADPQVSAAVRVRVDATLDDLASVFERSKDPTPQRRFLERLIRQHQLRPGPEATPADAALPPPPGSPIGVATTPGLAGCSFREDEGS